ncbi:MAG: hypothetical protein RL412_1547 [Pseudomonadota bacterium]
MQSWRARHAASRRSGESSRSKIDFSVSSRDSSWVNSRCSSSKRRVRMCLISSRVDIPRSSDSTRRLADLPIELHQLIGDFFGVDLILATL